MAKLTASWPRLGKNLTAILLVMQLVAFSDIVYSDPIVDIIPGEAILRIDDGDFVHPTFSPNGALLAYSKVIVENQTELTEVYLHEFSSGKTRQLLDATNSRNYATYKAFIYRLEWISNQRLRAYVSDGDVDTTLVEFDVMTGSVVDTRDGDLEMYWYEKANRWMQSVEPLPAWEPEVLRTAFENGMQLADGSFLIQPQYSGVEADIYRLTTDGKLTQIRSAAEPSAGALGGALQYNESLLFIQAESSGGHSKRAELLRYDNDEIEILASMATTTEPRLKPLFSDQSIALFFVSTARTYEINPGKLYAYSASGLTEWLAPGMLYDVVASATNKMLALVFWQNEHRVIEIYSVDNLIQAR